MDSSEEVFRLLKYHRAELVRHRKHHVYRLSNGKLFVTGLTSTDKRGWRNRLTQGSLSDMRKRRKRMASKIEQFVKFILARHAVYAAREAGKPRPWSNDPILQHYKFCNVFRELDRVSRWIAANWREPNKTDPDFWFASLVARRSVNLPATLSEVGYPVPWNPNHFLSVLARRKKAGKRRFNSDAYKVILSGRSGDLAETQVSLVLNPLWAARDRYRPRPDDTLMSFHTRLASVQFMGGFHAAQVVADVKYVGRLRKAADWRTFAASGPGSRRGLNRVLSRPTDARWSETDWLRRLLLLRKAVAPALAKAGLPKMHAQDLQNCLCEFDKYERIRLGEGKGRKFVPNAKPLPPAPKAAGDCSRLFVVAPSPIL